MPTLKHSEVSVAEDQGPSRAIIYLALAVAVFSLAVWVLHARPRKPTNPAASTLERSQPGEKVNPYRLASRPTSPTSRSRNHPFSVLPPWSRPRLGQGVVPHAGFESHQRQPLRGAALTPEIDHRAEFGLSKQMPPMDDNDSDPRKDRLGSRSASATSRGVSISASAATDFRHQQTPSPAGRSSGANVGGGRSSHSSYLYSSLFPETHVVTSSDGIERQPMSGHSSYADHSWSAASDQQASTSNAMYGQGPGFDSEELFTDSAGFSALDFTTPRHFSRPPPPPPLTPPTLDDPRFPFEDRRLSYAASIPPELDASFIHQSGPTYTGISTSADVPSSSSPEAGDLIPRRRSYTRNVPIGMPIPTSLSGGLAETMAPGASFSPSSYPPTSPLLPPPPPGGPDAPPEYVFVGGPGGPGVVLSEQEIDLHGEIISVMDDSGHGWKRHTRVYGGGVCLACLAAEDQGGFYGDRVPLSDRRR